METGFETNEIDKPSALTLQSWLALMISPLLYPFFTFSFEDISRLR
jgi:hypothetical protein